MKSSELRKLFLQYFKDNGHTVVKSSPLIPIGDPSLLFTTAGMVQFKPMFAGEVELKYTRAASCQKCFRTSDLGNVGKTPRHHTFFEMLGNFSFGDYFKKEAIEFAWDFSVNVCKLDPEKIYASVYKDDDDAYNLWADHIGIPKDRIVRLGKEDNFWGPAGASGACGPCSELYYDLGEDMLKPGDDPSVGGDNNRYIEYWNLVFNQFNQLKSGEQVSLPKTGIDTGMGLERLAIITQGVKSVYETDLFKPFIEKMVQLTKRPYEPSTEVAYHVIADHIRAIVFVMLEKILPSNEGSGYVIRRILRRAMRYGQSIGMKDPFLNQLVPLVTEIMGDDYPEIKPKQEQIQKNILVEEESFLKTLEEGSYYLSNLIDQSKAKGVTVISGEEAFKLYDSRGFPIDITRDMANEKDMTVDIDKYEQLMSEQKESGRENRKGQAVILPEEITEQKLQTDYVGEEGTQCQSNIVYLLKDDANNSGAPQLMDSCTTGDNIIVITEKTSFYGESGGQVGDHGTIQNGDNEMLVLDTQKINDIILHIAKVEKGSFQKNDSVLLSVDDVKKQKTAKNHSATHILQKALQKIVGDSIAQRGSLVNEDKLRFDFSHNSVLSPEQLALVEQEVNRMIQSNFDVKVEVMDKDTALKKGALAFFGDKYGHDVRTVQINDSFELCGGTHVNRSGDIGAFKILSESSIASGIRRIEAATGEAAVKLFSDSFNLIKELELLLNSKDFELNDKIQSLLDKNRALEKENQRLKTEITTAKAKDIISDSLYKIGDVNYISFSLADKDLKELLQLTDEIKGKYQNLVTLLISEKGNKVFYLSTISKNLVDNPYKASEIVKKTAEILNGKGGGKADKAQGSGSGVEKIPEALEQMKAYVESI